MKTVIVDINLPADRYVALYEGSVKTVQGVARDGRSVRFPGRILQQFLTRDGVFGSFAITFDDQNKFHSIQRLG